MIEFKIRAHCCNDMLRILWAIGAVGSALERHSRGHKFEPCIAQVF